MSSTHSLLGCIMCVCEAFPCVKEPGWMLVIHQSCWSSDRRRRRPQSVGGGWRISPNLSLWRHLMDGPLLLPLVVWWKRTAGDVTQSFCQSHVVIKPKNSRCVPCRTASARLRLTVREKAHPHLDFSCSFQNLHRLKRGKKLTGCTNQSFWWTKHQKQQPQQPLPEQRMIICSVKRRGDTDECRRCAGCVFCIHLCCSSVAIESMQWNSWPSLF